MELTALLIMAFLMPICTIAAFIIGYNINASKKIFALPKKHKPTEDEKTLEWINKAKV